MDKQHKQTAQAEGGEVGAKGWMYEPLFGFWPRPEGKGGALERKGRGKIGAQSPAKTKVCPEEHEAVSA